MTHSTLEELRQRASEEAPVPNLQERDPVSENASPTIVTIVVFMRGATDGAIRRTLAGSKFINGKFPRVYVSPLHAACRLDEPGGVIGLMQRTRVELSNLASEANAFPTRQSSREPFTNPDPVTSINVPPDAGPKLGLMDTSFAGWSNIIDRTSD